MANLALFQLIVYNLLQAKLGNVIIFHCWQKSDLLPLAQLISQNYIFSQYFNLNVEQANLLNFHKDYLDSDLTKLGVFLDLSCSHSSFITNQSSQAQLYTEHFHWLLYDETENGTQLETHFEKANLSINADVTYVKLVEKSHEGSLFTLYDVYNRGSHLGGKLNVTIDQNVYCNRSSCEIKEYLSELHTRTRLQQRSNLEGITFRQVALVTVLPLNSSEQILLDFLNSEHNAHVDWISRLGYRNNLHLQEMLLFNVSNVWVDQWSLNDTIGGAMGQVVDGHVELSTTAFVLSTARLKKIFPTTDIGQFRSVCIFRTPHNAGIKAGVFLEPFKPSVWLVFIGLLTLSGLLLWLIFRLEHHWMRRCLAYIPSLLTSCLISFGAACIQGSHLIPHSTGGRLAFMALMLTSFLMYNYYTSIVVSTLLGSPVRSSIKTIQQLADSSLDVGFETIPFNWAYLNSSPRSDIINLVKRKVDGRNPSSIWFSAEEGVLRVRDQPGFVFISEASFSYNFVEKYYMPHEICELNEILFRPESTVYTIVHRNSSYKELLKQIQLRMLEGGMTQKHRRFYTKTKLHCFSNNYVINVGMEYAAPLFMALLAAYIVAFVILMLELSWSYLSRRHLQRLIALFQHAYLTNNATIFNQFLDLNSTFTLTEQLQEQLVNHQLNKLGIFFDINCVRSAKVLEMANKLILFTDHFHWLIFDRNFDFEQMRERFADAQLYVNTELTYVEPKANFSNFILYDLYNKARHLGTQLNITADQQIDCNKRGCQVKRYLSDLHLRLRLQNRRYLTNITLRVNAAITSLPVDSPVEQIKAFLSSQDDIYKDSYARLGYQTHQVLKDLLDCNYSYTFRDRWTDSEVTGGLIGDLRNGSVDMTTTAFLYTVGRTKYFKPLTWHSSFRSVCMFRNPRSAGAELRVTEFLEPFSWTVWLMFSALLLFTGFLLWLTFLLERRLNRVTMETSLLTSCLLSFGAACIQGAWLLPRSTGGRMVFYAIMLTCFLMYNYYTSIVVSTLLGAPPKSSIRTIQQLADSNLEVAVEPTIYTKVYVETSEFPDIRSLYRKKILNKDPKRIWLPSEQGVLMVRNNPGFVFIAESASAYVFVRKHYLPHQICELNEILLRDETSANTIIQKNSNYAELFKLCQLRLLETGVHFKHFRYWVRNKLHCYQSNVTVVVGLESAGPLFLLLLMAYVICLFVLGLEILWHKRQLRKAAY